MAKTVKPKETDASQETVQQHVRLRQQVLISSEKFEGPLPHPDILRAYKEIEPDFATRLLKMVEDESSHRRALEASMVQCELECHAKMADHQHTEATRGQIFALIVCILSIAAGAYTISLGHPISGAILGSGGPAGVVTTFILGRFRRKEDAAKTATEEDLPDRRKA